MGHRINIMVDDDTWAFLTRVPAAKRTRVINDALREWSARYPREDAVREMDALSGRLPHVSAAEVVRWIREDREVGHS